MRPVRPNWLPGEGELRAFFGGSVAYPYYRLQLASYVGGLMPGAGPCSVLDVGAGDGRMAALLQSFRPETRVVAVETQIRTRFRAAVPFVRFDGRSLPMADRSFDVALVSNVLHHAGDPQALLAEVCRVTRRWIIIKDHLSTGRFDDLLLAILDVMGNRRFGAQTDARYLRDEAWTRLFEGVRRGALRRLDDLRFRQPPLSVIFPNRLEIMFVLEFNEAAV